MLCPWGYNDLIKKIMGFSMYSRLSFEELQRIIPATKKIIE